MLAVPGAFTPIEPGERDVFTFDFTVDLNGAAISSTSWTCAMAAQQSGNAVDPTPTARILGSPQIDGLLSKALIGTMIDGVNYVLQATVITNETPARTLQLYQHVLCRAAS